MNYLKYAFLLPIILLLSCGDDDDDGMALDYTICIDEIKDESERLNPKNLDISQWPAAIRTYVATEFPGFAIESMESYADSNMADYILLTMQNNGQLLFAADGTFLCGDTSFRDASGDDDYFPIENLPQPILDYITSNFPNRSIKKAEYEDGEYEVELDDNTELCFDQQGNFLGRC